MVHRLPRSRLRSVLVTLWLLVVAAALYVLFFERDLFEREVQTAASLSAIGAAIYLIMGCLRGFTLIPVTTLLVTAIPLFSPLPLFGLTLLGIVVSSSTIYWFADALGLDEPFRHRYARPVERLTSLLQRYELPVIVGWSFFPFVPTDVIGYVCGALEVNFPKYVIGVAIGEGAICALYIFLGHYALQVLELSP